MCGRYLLRNQPDWANHTPWNQYWEDISQFVPRYNIAPSQQCPVIINNDGQPQLVAMQWGFRPTWAKLSFAKINSRGETLFSSKMFSKAAHQTRCLVPADGFYEPKGDSSQKTRPWHLFQYEDRHVFMMAGIWTHHQSESEDYLNFSIVTTEANSLMKPIHHRMPVILEKEQWALWLNSSEDELQSSLESREYTGLLHYPVGDTAKNPRNEGPECAEPFSQGNLSLFD
ncbi:SOS response-associated peptidase [Pleionea sediminis]|uniref:SOS response-associated peptidase n=1 Tax=Pleionea sediminis TaxID=2569479 RepID=UPI0011866C0A|nr:SOS response-associated peptidase [Pleionea sediminis]